LTIPVFERRRRSVNYENEIDSSLTRSLNIEKQIGARSRSSLGGRPQHAIVSDYLRQREQTSAERQNLIGGLNLSYRGASNRNKRSATPPPRLPGNATTFTPNTHTYPKRPSSASRSRPEPKHDFHEKEQEYDGEQVLANIAHHISELANQTRRSEEKHREAEIVQQEQDTNDQIQQIQQLEEANTQITRHRDNILRENKELQLTLGQEQLLTKELQEKNLSLENDLADARGSYRSEHTMLATTRADKERIELELEHIKQKYDHMTRNYKNLQSLFKEEKKKRTQAEKNYTELQQQVSQMRLAIHQHKSRMEKSVKQAQHDALEASEKHNSAKEDISTLLNYISVVDDQDQIKNGNLVERVKDIVHQYSPQDKLYDRLSRRQSTGSSSEQQLQQPILRNFNDTKHLAGPRANSSTYSWEASLRGSKKVGSRPPSAPRDMTQRQQEVRYESPPRDSRIKEANAEEMEKLAELDNQEPRMPPVHYSPSSYRNKDNREETRRYSERDAEDDRRSASPPINTSKSKLHSDSQEISTSSTDSNLSSILNKLSVNEVAKLLKEVLGNSTGQGNTSPTIESIEASLTRDIHFPTDDNSESKKRREIEVKESIRRRVETEREKYGIY
jgi:myosin heavy subunit